MSWKIVIIGKNGIRDSMSRISISRSYAEGSNSDNSIVRNNSNVGTKGISLIEMVIASCILILIATAFLPVFSFVAKAGRQNREKMTANTLASSIIEEIRAMDYEDIGTIGGNPEGQIPQEQTRLIDGVEYKIIISITWERATEKDGKINEMAFKKIRVIVKAPGSFSGNIENMAEINSLVTRESEEPLYKAGGIRVLVKSASKQIYTGQTFTINVKGEAGSSQVLDFNSTNVTAEGEVYFGIVPEGSYTVKVKIPGGFKTTPGEITEEGWVVKKNVNVANWETTQVVIYMDKDENLCDLYLNTVNEKTNTVLKTSGYLNLSWIFEGREVTLFSGKGFSPEDLSDIRTGNGTHYSSLPADFFGKLWPIGRYRIIIDDIPYYYTFDSGKDGVFLTKDGENWDGTFDNGKETIYASALVKPRYVYLRDEYFEIEKSSGNIIEIGSENIVICNPPDNGAEEAFDNQDETYWEIVRDEDENEKQESVIIDLGYTRRLDKLVIRLKADEKFHFTLWGDNNLEDNKINGDKWNIKADKIYNEENITPQQGIYELVLDPIGLTGSYRYYIIEIKLTKQNKVNVVKLYEIDLYGEERNVYLSSREEIRGPIDLTKYSPAPRFTVNWDQSVPSGTKYEVYTAVTDSDEPLPSSSPLWTKTVKGGGITGIYEGQDIKGKYLWIKEVMTTTDPSKSPSSERLWVEYSTGNDAGKN